MGKRKGKKRSSKGSSNPQPISRQIEKRPNRHEASQVFQAPIFTQGHPYAPLNRPPFPPTIHQPHAFAPQFPPAISEPHAFALSYPSPASFPSAPLRASSSLALLQREDMGWGDKLPGYIFMCNNMTKHDCYKYRVMGLPAHRISVVEKIKPGMKIFLFDIDIKLLYGIYVAASNGVMDLEPIAFGGRFPAQVKFEIFEDCLPLPESAFKHIITYQGPKFKQELSGKQVADLISLFRPIHAVSLEQTTVAPRLTEPPNVETSSRPVVELSASYDQYLAAQRQRERYYGHVEQVSPFSHVPDVSITRIQPMHLQQAVSQPKPEQYYTASAHQAYRPGIPSLASLETHGRYTAIANGDEVFGEPAQAIVGSQGSIPLPGEHAHIPKPTLSAAYWTALASEDPHHQYSAHYPPLQESATSGSRRENVPEHHPLTVAAGSTTYSSYVPVNNAHHTQDVYPQASEYYYNPPNVVASTNYAPVQTHDQTAYQPTYDATYLPSSSQTAAYWTGVAAYQDPNNHQMPPPPPPGDGGLGGEVGAVPVLHG